MTKAAFESILSGLQEAVAIVEGRADPATYRVHTPIDVRAIRKGLNLSQEAFARRYQLSVGSIRDWEQGRKMPESAARNYLTVIAREPEAVLRALADPVE
jgi:putative transcriptional regulator